MARRNVTDKPLPRLLDSDVLTTDQWKGQPCIVLGGGPSMPVDLVCRSLPHIENVIAVNQAWRLCVDQPAVVVAIDRQVYELAEDKFSEEFKRAENAGHIRLTTESHAMSLETPRTWTYKFPRMNYQWGKSFEDGVMNANNSGLAAVNVADNLGASPIYLFGFDLKLGKGQPNNYHEDYPDVAEFRGRSPSKLIERWTKQWDKVAGEIRGAVWNANTNSAIQHFPFTEASDALIRCFPPSVLRERLSELDEFMAWKR